MRMGAPKKNYRGKNHLGRDLEVQQTGLSKGWSEKNKVARDLLAPSWPAIYMLVFYSSAWVRPYQHDSTASRLLSEVKHVRARLVLRWGTTLESRVLYSTFSFAIFFTALALE